MLSSCVKQELPQAQIAIFEQIDQNDLRFLEHRKAEECEATNRPENEDGYFASTTADAGSAHMVLDGTGNNEQHVVIALVTAGSFKEAAGSYRPTDGCLEFATKLTRDFVNELLQTIESNPVH